MSSLSVDTITGLEINRTQLKSPAQSFVLWFTGLSGAGKSTISESIYRSILEKGYKVEYLDGDIIRSLFPDMGFTKEERDMHVKYVGLLASALERNGIIVIASLISPYIEARQQVRKCCDNFLEVYVNAPLSVCEQRDVKGLYGKARNGEIKNFTGLDDPYESPSCPELEILTGQQTIEESCQLVMDTIKKYF